MKTRDPGTVLSRGQMLRALPKHVGLALLSGAVTGFILWYLKEIPAQGFWQLALAAPMLAVYVNGAVLPVVIPGRHWSFGFIGMMMLAALMIIGIVLADMFVFPHAAAKFPDADVGLNFNGVANRLINAITFVAILSGGGLGLLYGLVCGRISALVLGPMLGTAAGYWIGLSSSGWIGKGYSPSRFAFIFIVASGLLHLAACFGAALGAGGAATPASKAGEPQHQKAG